MLHGGLAREGVTAPPLEVVEVEEAVIAAGCEFCLEAWVLMFGCELFSP